MSELREIIEKQSAEISALRQDVHRLSILMMKDKVDTTWINEDTAAAMVNMTPAWFRRKVKQGYENFSLISYRHTNGRNFQYSRKSILQFKENTKLN